MERDNRDYVCDLIKRTENKLGIDFYVDWVAYNPISVFWDSASYCVSEKNGAIIFIPKRTKDRSTLRELVFHELGHAYVQNYRIPKYISNTFGNFDDLPFLDYQYRIMKNYSGPRNKGFVSRYAEVSPEEDFAETFSFVISGRKYFNGELILLNSDLILHRKIKLIKKLLRLN
jgi:hypothetical protein